MLDVGAGSGWTTALLARLVGPDGSVTGVELSPELFNSVYLPEGLGHALMALEDGTVTSYLCTEGYNPVAERALKYLDAGIAEADGDLGLWGAVTALPPRQRTVLMLRYHEQLSDEEIARMLGVSRGTVRSQAARGLDKLRHVAESQVEVRVNGR